MWKIKPCPLNQTAIRLDGGVINQVDPRADNLVCPRFDSKSKLMWGLRGYRGEYCFETGLDRSSAFATTLLVNFVSLNICLY